MSHIKTAAKVIAVACLGTAAVYMTDILIDVACDKYRKRFRSE